MSSFSQTTSACLTGAQLGTYTVTINIQTSNPPGTGTLRIWGNEIDTNISAPFSSNMTITLPAGPGKAESYQLRPVYSSSTLCAHLYTLFGIGVTAPTCCQVSAPSPVTVCTSQTLSLTATSTTGGNYNWTGPSSFSSTQQNPTIPNMTAAKAGTYQVTLTNGACVTNPRNVSVTVNPKPTVKQISHR